MKSIVTLYFNVLIIQLWCHTFLIRAIFGQNKVKSRGHFKSSYFKNKKGNVQDFGVYGKLWYRAFWIQMTYEFSMIFQSGNLDLTIGKSVKIGKISNFFMGCPIFQYIFLHSLKVVLKFVWKRSSTLDFIAFLILKDQNFPIFGHWSIPK